MDRQMNEIRILLIEDNPGDYEIVRILISQINQSAISEHWNFFADHLLSLSWVKTQKSALQKLSESMFDLILVDLSLPDSVGMETLSEIIAAAPESPVIVLSGNSSGADTLEAARYGAQDYLVKGEITSDQLARSFRYAIERMKIRNELTKASNYKNQFLANMSHELRTPLTAILGFSEMMARGAVPADSSETALYAIIRNSRHLLSLIDDILDLAKIEVGKVSIELIQSPLEDILSEVDLLIQMKVKEVNVSYIVERAEDLPKFVYSDPVRVKQILLNIIGNAVKFSPKGRVKFITNFIPAVDSIEFIIQDNGIGIPPEFLERVYQPFSQADLKNSRRFGGSGLGLAVSKQLVDLLGGTIKVESEVGKGTCFTITVPRISSVSDEILKVSNRSPITDVPKLSNVELLNLKGRVLVVDDAPDNCELLKFLLRSTGLDVICVPGGKEAVDISKRSPFDVVLMDIQMPGLDGYEATAQLRRDGFSGPIIALTARVGAGASEACLQAGCNAYIGKPFNQDELLQTLATHLKSTEASDGAPPISILPQSGALAVVESFMKYLPDKLRQLETAISEQDLEQLHHAAHKLANAEMFGFKELSRIAQKLEQKTEKDSFEECTDLALKLLRAGEELLVRHSSSEHPN